MTGSTNADLLAAGGAAHRSVLVTDHQTAGRGRLDRAWEAPAGTNVLMSMLFRDDLPADPGDLTRRVGLAAIVAATESGVPGARLKWPNDVLLGDEKLAGILAQRGQDGAVVVGLGLNVRWAPPGAARLGPDVAPADVVRRVLAGFDALPDDIDVAYRDALITIGRRVRVEFADSELIGTATGVEPDGRLVVLDGCAITHRIAAGDVVHLRPV